MRNILKTGNRHGMNWASPHKRLAIYLRDGLQCLYCCATIEAGAQLTLDHLRPRIEGGGNMPRNLITACAVCNSARGKRAWRRYASPEARRRIEAARRRRINPLAARAIIEARGGFTPALHYVSSSRSAPAPAPLAEPEAVCL